MSNINNPTNLTELYSGDDLEALFKGGFINFGYWDRQSLLKDKLTEEDAIRANARLYDEVFNFLNLKKTDDVLEVGSGHGSGAAYLSKKGCVHSITGLDYFQRHVDISINKNKESVAGGSLRYMQGQAENMPFNKDVFNKIYTIEAFQHFNVAKSIAEFARVLQKSGVLVIATFFATDKQHFPEILSLLPKPAVLSDFGGEMDAAMPDFLHILRGSFRNIQTLSIGEHVWEGYNKWVHQREPGIWDKNWLIAYRKKLIDYYIVVAEK